MRFLIVRLLFLFTTQSFGQNSKVDEFKKNFDLEILIDSSISSTWNEVTYSKISDTTLCNRYMDILVEEFSKYPVTYFGIIGISNIKICKDLKFGKTARAGIPDPYIKTLFLDANFNYSGYTESYFRRVMHHELHHCSEYHLWNDMYHKSAEWQKLNDSTFKYGNGGAEAYLKQNQGTDWFSIAHPIQGFANLYSTTGQEEDRCELVAMIMNNKERSELLNLCSNDPLLNRKLIKILNYLDQISGTKTNYWREKTGIEN